LPRRSKEGTGLQRAETRDLGRFKPQLVCVTVLEELQAARKQWLACNPYPVSFLQVLVF
jgi:hypothetical protein